MMFRISLICGAAAAFEKAIPYENELPYGADVLAMDAPPAPANRRLPWGPADCFVNPTFDAAQQKVMSNIQYGEANNPYGIGKLFPNKLFMDVHFPPDSDSRKERPVMVWIHGGSFLGGDKGDDHIVFNTMVERGYVVASINYRMVRSLMGIVHLETVKPAVVGVEDARAAVRYLRMKAKEWRLDTNRIVVGGDSAGALTSMCYGFTKNYTEGKSGNPGYDSAINAVLSVSGSMQDVAFCASGGKAPEYHPFGCVVNSVDRFPYGGDLTKEMQPGDIPFIEVHGTADTTIPYVGAMKTDAQANATGVPHDFITIPGAGHVPFGNMFDPKEPYFLNWLKFLSGALNLAEAECPKASPIVTV